MTIEQQIEQFLASPVFGVVGASTNRHKYGNKVLRCYLQHGYRAIPVHPAATIIEAQTVVSTVDQLPAEVASLSLITPPAVTEKIVQQAAAKGIQNIWMQPGAESPAAMEFCRRHGMNLIADGSCVLVVLGYREVN
ncbi:MAG: CoA-binding protein [Deltaproteobacteria bacterium]|nr:CoA-binding protein [Deltaproteobacteria bacterium]NCP02749.1 CoA-binding protein [Deltaproteobacteria bacterium]